MSTSFDHMHVSNTGFPVKPVVAFLPLDLSPFEGAGQVSWSCSTSKLSFFPFSSSSE